jgi:RHS repeat-associated protein
LTIGSDNVGMFLEFVVVRIKFQPSEHMLAIYCPVAPLFLLAILLAGVPAVAQAQKFSQNHRVQANTDAPVRDTPAGTFLYNIGVGSLGRIIGGPTNRVLNATTYTWYKVDWDPLNATDGWSNQDLLSLSPPNLTAPQGIEPPGPTLTDYRVVYSWESIVGPTRYHLFWRDTNTTQLFSANYSSSRTQSDTYELVHGHSYRWNMTSSNAAAGESGVSATRYFKIGISDLTLNNGNSGINVTPNPVYLGGNLAVQYTIRNIGECAAKPSSTRVQLKRGGSSTTTAEVITNAIRIGANASLVQTAIIPVPSNALEGGYTIYVILDRFDGAGQGSKTNNDTFQTSVGAIEILKLKPNLVPYQPPDWPESIVVSTTPGTRVNATQITSLDTLYIDLSVANLGNAPTTGNTAWRLLLNGNTLENFVWGVVEDSTYVASDDYTFSPLAAGQYELTLVADPWDEESESNETDNEYKKTISVVDVLSLNVLSPNNGNPMTGCNSYSVSWTASGNTTAIASFKFGYSTDSGSSFTDSSDMISASANSYTWTVPASARSTHVRVRIAAYNSSGQLLASGSNPSDLAVQLPSGKPTARPETPTASLPSGTLAQFYGRNSSPSSSCSSIASYRWDFPGDVIKTETNPTFTFTAPANGSATYYVSLKVTDANGEADTKTIPIYVSGFSLGTATPSSFSLDPVNLATGNYVYEHVDLRLTGKGFPFEFKRFYNSKFFAQSPQPLGYGWTHSYNLRLATTASNATITFHDGHFEVHALSAGQYIPEAGVYDVLTNNPDGSFTLASKDQMHRNFDPQGRLVSIVDKNNNALSLIYDGSILTNVTDTAGRQITFESDPTTGLLTRITDPINRSIQFLYDQTNLVGLIDARGFTNRFEYDTNHQMTAAFDARGTRFVQNIYDELQRVVSYQTDAYSNQSGFSYDFVNRVTHVTNALGKVSIHRHDERLFVTNIVDEVGNDQNFGYDDNRNRIYIRDKNGNETHYGYDSSGNVTNKIDALNKTTAIEYNLLNNPICRVDALTNATTFGYDSIGNLTSTTNALNHVSRIQYTSGGLPFILTDARGFSTTNEFDTQGNLVAVIDANGFTNQFGYDDVGRRIHHIDALNRTNLFFHDDNDNLLYTVNALGFTNSFTYDGNNNRTSSRDARGVVTSNIFDLKDRLAAALAPLSYTISNRYDALDRKLETRDARGNPAYFARDDVGNLITVTNALGEATRFTHDPNDNQTSAIDPTGHYVTNFFDALNRKTVTIDISVSTNLTVYDGLGRVTATTNANGQVTQFFHDAVGRLTNVLDSVNQPVFFDYDENGNRVRTTDPNGHIWTNVFDDLNRVVEQSDPKGHKTTFRYDPVGNLTNKLTPNGDSTSYSHDALNRLIQITYPTGPPVTFAYDSVGNRTNMTDSLGTTTWVFDDLNRLVSVTDPYGQSVTNEFDAVGNRVALMYPGHLAVRYGYDPLNRMVALTNWLGGAVTYGYDNRGNLTATTNADSTTAMYGYDVANRLVVLTNAGADASVIAGYALMLDGIGNHLESSRAQPLYPLLPNQTNNYSYDSDNRLTVVDGETVTHDENGNLTGLGSETFSYDFENRLVQFTLTNFTGACMYDGAGNRLAAITNGVPRRFVLDRLGALTQVLAETDTNGVVLARYVFGLGLAQRITPDGTVSTYHFDVRGSTVALTDTAGSVTDGYAYDSFGVLANRDGYSPQPFRYLGRHGIMDDSTGLYYARARHFSPQLGRFLTKDPLTGRDEDGQSLNRYVYALNNPLRFYDASGLSAQEVARSSAFSLPAILIQWTWHLGNWVHTFLRITPSDQERYANDPRFANIDSQGRRFLTIGAGPDSGNLVSDLNRELDIRPHDASVLVPVGGRYTTEEALIEALLSLDSHYQDNLEYDLFPRNQGDGRLLILDAGYNSNSYISGLLEAAGLSRPQITGVLPATGWDKPLPAQYFSK